MLGMAQAMKNKHFYSSSFSTSHKDWVFLPDTADTIYCIDPQLDTILRRLWDIFARLFRLDLWARLQTSLGNPTVFLHTAPLHSPSPYKPQEPSTTARVPEINYELIDSISHHLLAHAPNLDARASAILLGAVNQQMQLLEDLRADDWTEAETLPRRYSYRSQKRPETPRGYLDFSCEYLVGFGNSKDHKANKKQPVSDSEEKQKHFQAHPPMESVTAAHNAQVPNDGLRIMPRAASKPGSIGPELAAPGADAKAAARNAFVEGLLRELLANEQEEGVFSEEDWMALEAAAMEERKGNAFSLDKDLSNHLEKRCPEG